MSIVCGIFYVCIIYVTLIESHGFLTTVTVVYCISDTPTHVFNLHTSHINLLKVF